MSPSRAGIKMHKINRRADQRLIERQDKASEEEEGVVKDYLNTDIVRCANSGNTALYDTCFEWIKVESGK